jgi:amino acid adenylation domain-containing protein
VVDLASIEAALVHRSLARPDAPAISGPGGPTVTYQVLVEDLAVVASALRRLGVGPGDRVVVGLPSGQEMAVALVATACAAVATPTDPALRAGEYRTLLETLAPRVVLVPAGAGSVVAEVAAALGIARVVVASDATGRLVLDLARAGDERGVVAHAPGQEPGVLLTTSGTTSRPKLVPLTHANLLASAQGMAASLGLGPDDHCLDPMPLHHVHGLMALLASLVSGGRVTVTPRFDPARAVSWLDEAAPTWYTAAPPIHQAIALALRARRPLAARLRFVRSSSAPLPAALAVELEAALGAPVLEAYGMTEAAHQIAVNPPPPGARRSGSVGRPTGVDVAVVDAAGRALALGETGEIVIRGRSVVAAYADAPEATAAAFRDGWFYTGDVGRLDAEGYVYLTGRAKEIINRGGEKVAPTEIEEALALHPGVAEAVAFPVPHATLGEDVGAAVVLRPGATPDAREIRAFVAARLADWKTPTRVWVVPDVPRTATGKPQRAALAARLAPPTGPAPSEPPRSRLEGTLAELWANVLGVDAVGRGDDFFELGGNSLHAMLVASRLSERTGVDVSIRDVFECPTVSELAAAIEERAPVTRAAASSAPAIPRRAPAAAVPLSSTQRPVWMLHRLTPELIAYNVPRAVRLRGALDVEALRRALEALVHRHEALRTTFAGTDAEPVQVIAAPGRVALPLVDLGGLADVARERALADRLAADAARPFDLGADLMIRSLLVRLGQDDHALLLTLHHLASDGWSAGVLARDLAALYGAARDGRSAELPELPIQYADHALWERARDPASLEPARAYWRSALAGAPPALELPRDRARPAVQSHRGARHVDRLPPALTRDILTLSRRERVTPFMTLLAGWYALLCRYTAQEDLVVGTAIAARGRTETESLIGFFANMLALRTDLSGDPTFRELLGRVRATTHGAYAHADLPFGALVQELRVGHRPDRSPLVQVSLILQDGDRPELALPGLAATPIEVDAGAVQLDLSLSVTETPEGFVLRAQYSTDLFDAERIARMLRHFRRLLESAVADPARRVSALPLTDAAERAASVQTGGTRPATTSATLHGLVEAQAARTPSAAAVIAGDDALTYEALDRRASRLAERLRALDVGAGSVVAVCLPRSLDLIVALLGVLKAGAAYLPLDPDHPPARLAMMLGDSGARIALTHGALADRLDGSPARVVDDGFASRAEGEASAYGNAVETTAHGDSDVGLVDHPAYIIYTSGSTGAPKGVAVTHGSASSFAQAAADLYELCPGDRVLQFASVVFDAAIEEIFPCLARGATLMLRPEGMTDSPRRFLDVCRALDVTVLDLPTAYWHQLAAAVDEGLTLPERVRLVIIGGEAARAEVARGWAARFDGGVRLVNTYGPTEATVVATAWEVTGADLDGLATVPIGGPIAGVETFVLDGRGEPVPEGVVGELHIGGAGVARGYVGRPDLTAERFVPDAWSGLAGARLYRTGDLVRARADGVLEFVGRRDRQVKVRGFRIELGEVEAALAAHPSVRDASVQVRDEAGHRQLVAYVVTADTAAAPDLRRFLATRLPDYLVPARFVTLAAWPLTVTGKIDRAALAALELDPAPPAVAPVAPASAVEEALARLWAEVLGVPAVGPEDGFFDLGGESLVAALILSRVWREFGVDVSLRRFFDGPTVRELAAAIEQARAESAPGA